MTDAFHEEPIESEVRIWLDRFDHSKALKRFSERAERIGLPITITKSRMLSPTLGFDIGDEIEIASRFVVDETGVSRKAKRKEVAPVGARLMIYLPASKKRHDSIVKRGAIAYEPAAFRDISVAEVDALLAELRDRREAARLKAEAIVERWRARPESALMREQRAREQAVQANLPTEQVDAWIVAHMGYTQESLRALGKSTRRDRRHEARQRMSEAGL